MKTKAPAKKKVAVRKRKATTATASRRQRKLPGLELDLSQLSKEESDLMNAFGLACAKSVVAAHEERAREAQ